MIERVMELDGEDDVGFVHAVRPMVAGVVERVAPAELYVVKVDSWFGDRWLGFSHKLMGLVGVQHRSELRVPPFVPARVRSEWSGRRDGKGAYVEEARPRLHIDQTRESNRKRLMSVVCPEAAVIWWSGSTRTNRRGALMAYLPTAEGHVGWYAELKEHDGWRVAQTIGTTAHELTALTS